MKRVALQQGLENLGEELKSRGYEVVAYGDQGHIDAIVYSDIYSGLSSVNNSAEGNAYGAILINANNKTVDEIVHIIDTRRYERLFTS